MNQKILTKNAYFQNFSWFQFYIYKLCMIMFIGSCSIDCCVKLIFVGENLCENDLCLIPLGKCASQRRATNSCKISIFNLLRVPSLWNLEACL